MKLVINTSKKQEFVDITNKINEIIKKSKIKSGLCNVFVRHATAAIIINENQDPHLCDDFLKALNNAFPEHADYSHDLIDDNAGAHIKAAILGPSVSIPFENSKLKLGTWQAVMFVELDGPRAQREVEITLIENKE